VQITDAVALVTGGASGLGLATTRRLLDAGAQVVVLDLKGEEVVRELGDRARFAPADVTDEKAVTAALDIAESLGAGASWSTAPAPAMPSRRWARTARSRWRRSARSWRST
jgi:NAD(P)-dependent dehydrogenase (short-subunit alcohol dehydrogenase family)